MVYVDKLFTYSLIQISHKARHNGKQWCHLFADSIEELHEFAERLGLRREWFQNKKLFPHYDLVTSKRKLAISLGAQEVDLREHIKKNLLKVTSI